MNANTTTNNTTIFAIESRWPSWSRWRRVTAKPHSELYQFDQKTGELRFSTEKEALNAAAKMSMSNAGEYRTVKI